jgi:dihydrolipoamide dehydrogenase
LVDRRLSVDQLSRAFAVYPSLTSSITDLARSMHIVDRGPDLDEG